LLTDAGSEEAAIFSLAGQRCLHLGSVCCCADHPAAAVTLEVKFELGTACKRELVDGSRSISEVNGPDIDPPFHEHATQFQVTEREHDGQISKVDYLTQRMMPNVRAIGSAI